MINKPLIIIGGSGHGSVIEACINDNRKRYHDLEWQVAGFCNDFDSEVDGYPVLGKLVDIPKLVDQGYYFIWAIHLIGRNFKTYELFNKIIIPEDRWATIIHKSAFVDSSVTIGKGCFVMYNAYIAPRTKIGKCVMIKANTNIGHDVVIGDCSHIAMGATVGSFAKIGVCSDVALASSVLEYLEIGDFAMLGAASLATHNIPNGQIYVGSPATFLKPVKED